ncbi:hypothetical protein AB0C18_38030 [Nonomuraea muscovyensis]|uniref:hypothetical protein n=1 Tax=Nonomuraea muscovyensis TaxID=1124761 RepID=UPI0033E2A4E7
MDSYDDIAAVDVVLFQIASDGRAVPVGAGDAVDLTAPGPPGQDQLRALLDASMELAADGDLPGEVVRAISAWPVPSLFRRSPWLYQHRALVFDNGRCAVGGHVLRHHDALGLYVDEHTREVS